MVIWRREWKMKLKTITGMMLTLLLMGMSTLAFDTQPAACAKRMYTPSSVPYTDFHDLIYASSSNLQAIVGFAYEPFDQPELWLSLGELNPDFLDPWHDNNNFVPANGRLLISVQDVEPLSEQILTVESDTDSLSKIYVPSTNGTTDWLYLWVAEDGSTYHDKEMEHLARAAPPGPVNLVGRKAWVEHSHFLMSKAKDENQTLYGLVKNTGNTTINAGQYKVVWTLTTPRGMISYETIGTVDLAPKEITTLTYNIPASELSIGKYYVEAKGYYYGIAEETTKTFTFKVS